MKVIFGAEIWDLQNQGGISRYFYELIRRLANLESFHVSVLKPKQDSNPFWEMLSNQEGITLLNEIPENGKNTVYHPTYYSRAHIALAKSKSFSIALTVFDLIAENNESLWDKIRRRNMDKVIAIDNADLIICISGTTEKDLHKYYSNIKGATTVIHLASSFVLQESSISDFSERRNQIVYVGKRHGYKNFIQLLYAFKNLCIEDDSLRLMLCGGEPLSKKEQRVIDEFSFGNRIYHSFPTDSELANVYSNSKILVSTSRMEGFGLPLIEAAASGCLVVCSDIEVYREIANKIGNFFPLDNSSNLQSLITSLLYSKSEHREEIKRNVIEIQQRYSWPMVVSKTAEAYVDIFKREKMTP